MIVKHSKQSSFNVVVTQDSFSFNRALVLVFWLNNIRIRLRFGQFKVII